MEMCNAMAYVVNELPDCTKDIVPFGQKEISEYEFEALKIYSKSYIDTVGFENNIIVPSYWNALDDKDRTQELASGLIDYVEMI